MIFERLEVGSYAVNCYIIASEKTKNAAIIDPGAQFDKIDDKIVSLGLNVKMIILTHCHGDHIGAVQQLVDKYHIPVYIHEADAEMLQDSVLNYSQALFRKDIKVKPDVILKDGDTVELDDLKLQIIHTPGHTPGGISIKVENILLTGDTLFCRSIGRTDFNGGSFEEIIDSIKNKLLKFSDDTLVYPGHNSPTTIGAERNFNPFVR